MDNKTIRSWESLADYISQRSYGEIVRYQEIETVTGERRRTAKYYNAISKAKKLLEEQGKMIVSIEGGDYRIIYPGDYTKEYAGEVKKARNRLKHGKRILDGAPVQDMSEDEQQTYQRVYDFNARLSASFAGSVTEVKRLTGKQHPMETALNQIKMER